MNIEKNILMSPSRRGRPRKYPFPDMEIGDSIIMGKLKHNSARVCASKYGRKAGKKFETRVTKGKMRIWRTA